jgi:hypothetical protein
MDGLQDGVSLLIDSVHAIRSCTYCALRETGPVTRLVMQLFAQAARKAPPPFETWNFDKV